jgi:hypothetical protein
MSAAIPTNHTGRFARVRRRWGSRAAVVSTRLAAECCAALAIPKAVADATAATTAAT